MARELPADISAEERAFIAEYEDYLNPTMVNEPIRSMCSVIHLAADRGYSSAVRILIENGATVNPLNNDRLTPLILAVVGGHSTVVDLLIEAGADINAPLNEDGETLLHRLILDGKTAAVALALGKGAIVDAVQMLGFTPLHYAINAAEVDSVKILLDHDASIFLFNNVGQTALDLGQLSQNQTICSLLQDKLTDFAWQNSKQEFSLREYAKYGNSDFIPDLLDAGVNIDAQNFEGMSALHWAAERMQPVTVALLLAKGAKIGLVDKYGRTPLHLAAFSGNEETVAALLKNGANPNSIDNYRKKPIHYAMDKSRASIIELLTECTVATPNPKIELVPIGTHLEGLETRSFNGKKPMGILLRSQLIEGIDNNNTSLIKSAAHGLVDINSSFRVPPLLLAVERNHQEAVSELLRLGADVNAKNSIATTPLHLAVIIKSKLMVKTLLKNGANVDSRSDRGYKPIDLVDSNAEGPAIKQLLLDQPRLDSVLIGAAKIGDIALMRDVLDDNAFVNAKDAAGMGALHYATHNKHREAVKWLLTHHANPSIKSPAGVTPLHIAASSGDSILVSELLSAGAKLNATNDKGTTPLHSAASKGHKEVVKLLLAAGASLTAKNSTGQTAFDVGAEKGHVDLLELLKLPEHIAEETPEFVQNLGMPSIPQLTESVFTARIKNLLHPDRVNNKLLKSNFSPIHIASAHGYNTLIERMIELGARVDKKQEEHELTPLHIACGKGKIETVKLLLDRGASIDSRDKYGNQALNLAILNKQEGVAIFLLEHGAKVDVTNNEGRTPLMIAVDRQSTDVVKAILRAGADPTITYMDTRGVFSSFKTAMDIAEERKNDEIKSLLMQAIEEKAALAASAAGSSSGTSTAAQEATTELTPEQKNAKLRLYAKTGKHPEAKALIEAGAEVNSKDSNNKTALHLAAINGDDAMVRLLLDNGAEIDATDNRGFSAAHWAALKGKDDVMKTLIARHANLQTPNSDGKNPEDLAKGTTLAIIQKTIAAAEHPEAFASLPAEGGEAASHEHPETALAGADGDAS